MGNSLLPSLSRVQHQGSTGTAEGKHTEIEMREKLRGKEGVDTLAPMVGVGAKAFGNSLPLQCRVKWHIRGVAPHLSNMGADDVGPYTWVHF